MSYDSDGSPWWPSPSSALAGFVLHVLAEPLYEAKSQLSISVKAGATAADVYQSNEFAGKRVSSYTALSTSTRVPEAVAQD